MSSSSPPIVHWLAWSQSKVIKIHVFFAFLLWHQIQDNNGMLIMKFWPLNLLTYYNYFREFLTDGHFAVFICLASTFSLNSFSLILICWHFCNHRLCNRGLWNTWKNLYKTFWWGWFDFNSDIVSVYIISNMILTILIIPTIWIMLMTIIWWILARAAPYPTRLPN